MEQTPAAAELQKCARKRQARTGVPYALARETCKEERRAKAARALASKQKAIVDKLQEAKGKADAPVHMNLEELFLTQDALKRRRQASMDTVANAEMAEHLSKEYSKQLLRALASVRNQAFHRKATETVSAHGRALNSLGNPQSPSYMRDRAALQRKAAHDYERLLEEARSLAEREAS
jgi:hypothetical protein